MFDGVKVFSATKYTERDGLGDKITDWLAAQRDAIEIVDRVVSQSSDSEFHCLSIVLFYRRKVAQTTTPTVRRLAGGAQ